MGTIIVLSEGSDSSDDTFLERILPSDLFIVAGYSLILLQWLFTFCVAS